MKQWKECFVDFIIKLIVQCLYNKKNQKVKIIVTLI
jgi:hypothetical protein